MPKITKAEILWTRTCNVKCSYCAMSDGRRNSQNRDFWFEGFDNLKALGCEFAAFCGAEALTDMQNLGETIGYAESLGIHTTVITSGVVANFKEKLADLHHEGAKSLTMSYDMVPLDDHSRAKSSKAIEGLTYFQSLGNIRDTAIIVTLTRKNYVMLPYTIKKMSRLGIWTFFDLIHHDRGQPGSKVKTTDLDLSFREEDLPELDRILAEVQKLKDTGYMCHASKDYLAMLQANDHQLIKNYDWNCANEPDFPAWVTVDCDGRVYCCDDFQIRDGEKEFYLPDLEERFTEFSNYWRTQALLSCPGCCWNHHIDAHGVKSGRISIRDYVHGIKE